MSNQNFNPISNHGKNNHQSHNHQHNHHRKSNKGQKDYTPRCSECYKAHEIFMQEIPGYEETSRHKSDLMQVHYDQDFSQ